MHTFQTEANMEWVKNNVRPLQAINQRVIRTNISHKSKVKNFLKIIIELMYFV